MVENPSAGVLGPWISDEAEPKHILSAGGRDILRHVSTNLHGKEDDLLARFGRQPYEVDYVPGTVVMVRQAVFSDVGFFDESFFFGVEMAELCKRARKQGSRCLIDPRSRALHNREIAGSLRSELFPYYILRNRLLFARRFSWPTRSFFLVAWSLYGGLKVFATALWRDHEMARLLWQGLRDGWMGRGGRKPESEQR
jgi:GT2 family glycosyltransferase